ncbi:hypothetical protein JXA32_03710 [Candidatus Sumerlaeota bacterium]|nr:hypothetical protein [Candidatus Sumerlaeota bacterium]
MKTNMRIRQGLTLAILMMSILIARGQTIDLAENVRKESSLSGTTVNMTGHSELHLTDETTPLTSCTINLNSPDAWLFLEQVKPSVVVSTYLSQIRVNGAEAALDHNVRVVQHLQGAVIIPHAPDYKALKVFTGGNLTGQPMELEPYTYYRSNELGDFNDAINSFVLKRGYMATFAQEENGGGFSKCYVAQDYDITVGMLPPKLRATASFVRIIPWRWVDKKGWCGGGEERFMLDCGWYYDWNNVPTSPLDMEYIPMRHNRNWNDFENINVKRESTQALGFNEPNSSDQADMSVEEALALWPRMLESGLRLGSPAPTDGGAGWLYEFMRKADERDLRVDFVAFHFYRAGWDGPGLVNWMRDISEQTGHRPIWITEFNNGANWTGNEPTQERNAVVIGDFIQNLNAAPFIERYAIYNWVQLGRELVTAGKINPAGVVYRDTDAPMAYQQEIPEGYGKVSHYQFEGNVLDSFGSYNTGIPFGNPAYVEGKTGQAIDLDGENDCVALPSNLGDVEQFTFAAWINWDGGADNQRLLDFSLGRLFGMYLTPKSQDGTMRFAIATSSWNNEQTLKTAPPAEGEWTHVAVTLQGETGKLYVNGALADTNTTMTIERTGVSTVNNYIGRGQHPANPYFNGQVDEARIFNYALSDEQIAALYEGSQSNAPVFMTQTIARKNGMPGMPYSDDMASFAADIDTGDVLAFSKAEGPDWLQVSEAGALTGIPAEGCLGPNQFTVRVTDRDGNSADATLDILINEPMLVPLYKFDGDANDSSGKNFNGTECGTPTYVEGVDGQALSLDADDDYILLPKDAAKSDDLTIAAWVYWEGGAAWQRIMDFGNGTGEYLFLTPRSAGGTLRFGMRTVGGGEQTLNADRALSDQQWVHVAVTLSDDTGKLYVNGQVVDTETMTMNPNDIAQVTNYIGKSQWPDPMFKGRIDDFRVYNYALSDEQIRDLPGVRGYNNPPRFVESEMTRSNATAGVEYTGQTLAGTATDDGAEQFTFSKVDGPAWLQVAEDGALSGTPGADDAGPAVFTVRVTDSLDGSAEAKLGVTVKPQAMILHYEFDGNVDDISGAKYDTPTTTTGNPEFAEGKINQALAFDGDEDAVILPAGIADCMDFTVATWVYWMGGEKPWQRIFDFGAGRQENLFLTPQSGSNVLRFGIRNRDTSEELDAESALVIGEWTHVAVVLNGGTGKLYINGAEAASKAITLNPADFRREKNYIGKSQYPDPLFVGRIDDFRVYNYALTSGEIAVLAGGGKQLEE